MNIYLHCQMPEGYNDVGHLEDMEHTAVSVFAMSTSIQGLMHLLGVQLLLPVRDRDV